MKLVQVEVKRHSTNGSAEININVQTTPAGSLLVGAVAIWIGTKLFKLVRRRWWLPVSAGVGILALRQLASARKDREETSEEE